jgi:hypothetical protein
MAKITNEVTSKLPGYLDEAVGEIARE